MRLTNLNTAKRLGRITAVAILLAIAAAGLLRLTGAVRYLVTNGVSMTPLYHSGDLVMVRSASHYQVGQIAAYRSQLLHTTVLHRIVAISGSQYTFKGDHNTWLDPEHPTAGQLVGRAWLHVPHGGILLALHGALLLTVGAAAFAALMLLKPERTPRTRQRLSVAHRHLTFGLLGAELILAVALAVTLATGRSTTTPAVPSVSETSTFNYGGQTKPNPVYPDGTLHTGDPVFVHVASAVTVIYDYQASGYLASQIRGTTSLRLNMSSASGWHRDTTLGPPATVTAGHGQVSARVDLASLEATLAAVRSLTDVDTGTVALTIHAVTDVVGAAGGSDHLDIPMNLQMTPNEVSLASQSSGAAPGPIITRNVFPHAPSHATPAPAAARFTRVARTPLIVAMVIVTLLLGLHFYPTPEREARAA